MFMERVDMPANLVAAAREEGREDWLDGVPATVRRHAEKWCLTMDPPFQPGGQTAWVAPARDAHGAELVMKVAWRHQEAEQEPDALALWAGRGAVLLHHAAELDDTIVTLLERCRPGVPLSVEDEAVQDDVIVALLRRAWVEPPPAHRFRPLAQMCERWARQFDIKRAATRVTLDAALVDEGIGVFRTLAATADRDVVLCTDLHSRNVLAAERERWLIIDPKPYVGDPTYDVIQHLLNCPTRLRDDPDALIAKFADLLDLDRERLRLWLFARCVQESPGWPNLADVARRVTPS